MKNLSIYIGNFRNKSALFEGEELLEEWGLDRFEF
jgi:hypothetical protein